MANEIRKGDRVNTPDGPGTVQFEPIEWFAKYGVQCDNGGRRFYDPTELTKLVEPKLPNLQNWGAKSRINGARLANTEDGGVICELLDANGNVCGHMHPDDAIRAGFVERPYGWPES